MWKGCSSVGGLDVVGNVGLQQSHQGPLWIGIDQETWEWHELRVEEEWRPSPRDLSQVVHIGGSKLLVFGGRAENGKVLNDLWGFDVTR